MNGTEQILPTVEGLTPAVLWYTLVGLVGIGALIVLYDKVRTVFKKRREERRAEQQLEGTDITDRIAEKVEEKLQPKFAEINGRFAEIETKLGNDKQDIEMHTRQLNAYEDRVNKLERGNNALCHGVFALLTHQIDGNNIEKLKKTQEAMRNYLIDGEYREVG